MLGQFVCTTPMCYEGEASVNQMDGVYQSLPYDVQSKFQSSHDSIMSSFNSYWVGLDKLIPFDPSCCSIQQIGLQADNLTSQMQIAIGQHPNPGGPGTQGASQVGTSSLLLIGLAIAAVFLIQSGRVTVVR